MRDYYAPALLSRKGKAMVSFTSVALFAFSLWAMYGDFDINLTYCAVSVR